ncbi:MAG: cytochrome c biogenesis protein CcdA [Firmicutes bacterium]|nr:cytochrome c biogenesis protein CcdA [Bacillota bacterium]
MIAFLENFGRFIDQNPFFAFPLAFLAGLISAFSPCVLASIPLILGYVGAYAADRRQAVRYSLLFSLGLAATFTLLGALAALLGRIMTGAGRWFYLFLGGLAALIGFWLLGLFGPVETTCRLPRMRAGGLGAVLVGAVAGVISSPCATPPLAAILAYVAGRANIVYGVALLAAYALGHCALIFLAGTAVGFAARITDSPGLARLAKVLRAIFGILTLIIAGYLFYLGL